MVGPCKRLVFVSYLLFSLLLAFFLSACATAPEDRTPLAAPSSLHGFSAVYSEFDMYLQLVTVADASRCRELECVVDRAFDQRIRILGRRLADVAYRQYPALHLRFPRFEFIVADKVDAGSGSSAGGTVVIYRGVRQLDLDDAALAFVLAREMSHVIGGNHDDNAATSILVAVAAQILFPVLNVAQGVVAATSSLTSTAMTSAASFAGSRALRASFRPQQLREAETIAMKLLAGAGWDGREVSDQLQAIRPALPGDPDWVEELRGSARRIASAMQGPAVPQSTDDAAPLQITPELLLNREPSAVKTPD